MKSFNSVTAVALITSVLAGAPALAAHRIDITNLSANLDGAVHMLGTTATSVVANSNVSISCAYHLERDHFLLTLGRWTGEISVAGRVLRTFPGPQTTGDYAEVVTWVAEPAGNFDVRCRLDTLSVAGVAAGTRDSHVTVTVTPAAPTAPKTVLFRCPDKSLAVVGLPSTTASGQVALLLSRSQAEADVIACYYSGVYSGANIRDYRLTFPCIGAHSATTTITAHPTTIADGTSNTLILKETAATYVCNVR